MMKTIKILLFFVLTISTDLLYIRADEDISINEQTFLVYRRYYFVARLDKTIKLLAKMYHEVNAMQYMLADRSVNFSDIVPSSSKKIFAHKQVARSVDRMIQTRSLKPLFMVWDSFKSYKSLHDDLLVEDFSKEIFIITRNTINCLQARSQIMPLKHKCMNSACVDLNLNQRIEAISIMTEHLSSMFDGPSSAGISRVGDMDDLKLAIHTDEVAFRYYCLHRLSRAMEYLLSQPIESDAHVARAPLFHWQKRSKKSKTLPQLWDDVKQYKYVDNDRFIHDFVSYVFILLSKQCDGETAQKRLSHADVIAIHQQVEQLPIEDILNAIDVIVSQVGSVVDHYQKSGLSFSQWIKQYWWAPPLLVSTVILKFIAFYYQKYHATPA